jgi:hypothetical protein
MGEFLLRPQLIDSGVVTVSVEVDTEGNKESDEASEDR